MCPSSIRTSLPGRRTEPSTAGPTGRSSGCATSSPAMTTDDPCASSTSPLISPTRSFGPCRSAMSATGLPASFSASRTSCAVRAWSSWVPWDMLRRAPSIPAPISAATTSGLLDAGPIVATIFVRRMCPVTAVKSSDQPASARRPREGRPAGVGGLVAELLLDAQELVVLRHTIGSRGRARLDLPRVRGDRDVGDRRVLRLARAMRDDDPVAVPVRQLHRVQRLRQRPDLVHLDEDRVPHPLRDPAPEEVDVRHEQVVADQLEPSPEPVREGLPALPVGLSEAVLDRHDRESVAEVDPEVDHAAGVERAALALEVVAAVAM